MSENTTTNPGSEKQPIKGTHWASLDAMSSHRLGTTKSNGDTDWAKWIEANKNNLIVATIVLLVAVFGGGYVWNQKNKSKEIYNAEIYKFEKNVITDYAKTGNAEALVGALKALHQTTGNYVGLIPAVIKTSDSLVAHGKKDLALEVLLLGIEISSNEYARFFINTRLAVVYEDLGKNQEAIDVLNKIIASDLKVFEGKYYLDTGRIYQKMGNNEKAKASFQYVVDKAKDDAEFVKIAKLHLANL